MTIWTFPRESREWVGPLTVTLDGTPTTTYTVALVAIGSRPETWVAPDVVGTDRGVLVGPEGTHVLEPGVYQVWARVDGADPERPVLADVARVVVT